MQLPEILQGASLTRLLQGIAVGAVATMVIGFNWGGWTLGGTARDMVSKGVRDASVETAMPYCVEKFNKDANRDVNLAEMKKVSSWQQGSFIEKGGWATPPDSSSPNSSVARACAERLGAAKVAGS